MTRKYPHGEECRYQAGRLDPLVEQYEWYRKVPKEPVALRAYRKRIVDGCGERTADKKRYTAQALRWQQEIQEVCAADPLFFINLFCWIVEPRVGEGVSQGIVPFNTWANQDPVIAAMAEYWGVRHLVGDKSRAQGFSWILCAMCVWSWRFHAHSFIGLGSKNKETADDPNDPASLGWKLDFLIAHLPKWLRPTTFQGPQYKWTDRRVSTSTWKNPDNGSFMKCYAATEGIGRAGRYTVFGLDESAFFPTGLDREAVANLVRTTNCLIMVSTPNGMDNEHYDRVHNPGPWLKLVLDWRDNPYQNRGLYRARNGKLELLDPEYDYPADYHFKLDGLTRSPWFDEQCEIHNNDMLFIAQELNREYSGSKARPFPSSSLDRAAEFVRKPLHTGWLHTDSQYPEDVEQMLWEAGEAYTFDLWERLELGKYLPLARYVIGCDLSQGVGGDMSSNSVAEIFNLDTKEQVGELATNTIPPVEFANLCVSLCYWLGRGAASPILAWEANGPGIVFAKEVKRLAYPNAYIPRQNDLKSYGKRGPKPGIVNSDMESMLAPLRSAFVNGQYTFHSAALLEECSQYVIDDNGKPVHPRARTSRDGGSRGVSHGDRTIAAAVAVRVIEDLAQKRKIRRRKDQPKPEVVPLESIQGRFLARERVQDRGRSRSCRF